MGSHLHHKNSLWDLRTNSIIVIRLKILNICKQKFTFMADTRLLVVFFPLLAAASWALFNIGRVALQQLKRMS